MEDGADLGGRGVQCGRSRAGVEISGVAGIEAIAGPVEEGLDGIDQPREVGTAVEGALVRETVAV